jgi:hypothetical protein
MKNLELLQEIAFNNNLEIVETTSNGTGYPEDLQYALVGFESFEQMESIMQEHNLRSYSLKKRDGWNLWCRQHQGVYEPYELDENQFGTNAEIWHYGYAENYFDFAIDELKNCTLSDLDIDWNRIEKEQDLSSLFTLLGYYERKQDEGDEEFEDVDFNELYEKLRNHNEILDAIKNLKEGYAVVTNYGELQEASLSTKFMSYHDDDVTAYSIALIA